MDTNDAWHSCESVKVSTNPDQLKVLENSDGLKVLENSKRLKVGTMAYPLKGAAPVVTNDLTAMEVEVRDSTESLITPPREYSRSLSVFSSTTLESVFDEPSESDKMERVEDYLHCQEDLNFELGVGMGRDSHMAAPVIPATSTVAVSPSLMNGQSSN